jgi:phosphoribosylglycinamide formyltransferase-1
MKQIAIFASGTGSNARNIIKYFQGRNDIHVACIICNNPKAKVAEVAEEHHLPFHLINRNDLFETEQVLQLLKEYNIELIVLAGFLWKIPEYLLASYPKKIINIHPALLPKYGGAGMYGMHVHEAVLKAKEKETGITIHFLNEHYDEGEIILQKKVNIDENDTPDSIAQKVHALEFEWFPKTIDNILNS